MNKLSPIGIHSFVDFIDTDDTITRLHSLLDTKMDRKDKLFVINEVSLKCNNNKGISGRKLLTD